MEHVPQPSGTVTLVFTDIEGSTRLLASLGEVRYLDALSEHRKVVRAAFGRYRGYEAGCEGDSFFYAFSSVAEAVQAASDARIALRAGPVRLRVGVHSGEPGLDPPNYVGLDVHKAARVMAAGHGGQVLLSQKSQELLAERFPVRYLGEYRLKDFLQPERLYQLGTDNFPPLKVPRHANLPLPTTTFLGREREVEELAALIRDSEQLVTLTGAGGAGKTRLALQVAALLSEEFPDGVWWVPLASLQEPSLLLSEIARVLELDHHGQRDLSESLPEALAPKRLLLVLDNVEHLLPDAAIALSPLRGLDGPALLVTSRERLRISGEHVYEVLPLVERDALALFIDRSQTAGVSVEVDPVVEGLCARLDNLPLALELAAALMSVLSPTQMLERLSQRLDLLKGARDLDPRQQTLRSTIEWSYDLLSPDEQDLFARLAVFAGGGTLEAVEQICDARFDTLAGLIDKSLVRRSNNRYWMLETIRVYAAEHPQTSMNDVRRRHATFYKRFAIEAEQGMRHASVATWFDRVEEELPNLRATMEYSLGGGEPAAALRVSSALERFWQARAQIEGATWVQRALATNAGTDAEWSAAAITAGSLAHLLGENGSAIAFYRAAIDRASRSQEDGAHARALGLAAWLLAETGAGEEALAMARRCQALGERVTDPWTRVDALGLVPNTLRYCGDPKEADALLREHLALRRALGDQLRVCGILNSLGFGALLQGDDEDARTYLEESLDLARTMSDTLRIALALGNLGILAVIQGEHEKAVSLLTEALRLCTTRGDRRCGGEVILGLAAAYAALGHLELAEKLDALSTSLFETTGIVIPDAELDRLRPFLARARGRSDPQKIRDFANKAQPSPLHTALAAVEQIPA